MIATNAPETPGVAVPPSDAPESWRTVVARYQHASVARSLFQFASTMALLGVAFYAMYRSLETSYWITLALAIPTAGLLVKTFIIMHDCSHSSFLPWRRANDAIGFVTGVLTMTPFAQWRRDHALHHASSGDLDRRGHGDIDTLTVREYLARTPKARLAYRISRHPAVLLGFGPIYLMVSQRFRRRSKATGDKEIASILWTNVGIVVAAAVFSWWIGFLPFILVYFPAIYIAGVAGVWLFYVQHQYADTYWEKHDKWDYATAAMAGSSYFKLPVILDWFTGSIGVHHVHHLGPRIPNYRLHRAHDENPMFHRVHVLTLADAFRVLTLSLWDEEQRKLVHFRDVATA